MSRGPASGGSGHAADDTAIVHVALGDRAYDVLIGAGLAARAGELIAARLGGRAAIVTDSNVAAHHLAVIEASLAAAGRHRGTIVLPPGEGTKASPPLATCANGSWRWASNVATWCWRSAAG